MSNSSGVQKPLPRSLPGLPRPALYWAVAAVWACGCAGARLSSLVPTLHAPPALPSAHTLVRDQLVIACDFPLAAKHRLVEELAQRRIDVCELLALPASDEPIHVYLFESAARFDEYVRLYHPQFPARRAFFLATDTRLRVYAQWGDYVAEDLRHEVTHGYLHAVVPRLPLWLDEGLAEYFELPRGSRGVHQSHLKRLVSRLEQNRFEPSLARLEALGLDGDMTEDDYAEAWAWVHLMLESDPAWRDVLQSYLADLRQLGESRPLSVRLQQVSAAPREALIEHLVQLIRLGPETMPMGGAGLAGRL